jgi:hypothetical protein
MWMRPTLSEENSSASETDSAASLAGSKEPRKKKAKACTIFHPEHEICTNQYAQTKATKAADDHDSDVSVEEMAEAKKGWNPVKSEWVFELWTP